MRCTVRVARWDLSSVDLVDPDTGAHLATLLLLDKQRNAGGRRRAIHIATQHAEAAPSGVAPRLCELMRDDAATGLPPAYLTSSRALNRSNVSPLRGAPEHESPRASAPCR